MSVMDGLDEVQGWQEEVYRHLHQHPELSSQETKTAAEVARRLTSFGFDVQAIGGGVVGTLVNGPGPTVLFRADMDALPVLEQTGLPYASTDTATDAEGRSVPVMHACGHDVHVAAGLGAAAVLASRRDGWAGTYLALFQPAEETASGAHAMVADGLTRKVARPDVALGQHVLASPAAGRVAIAPGPILATGACIRIRVFGKGSHGSMPHLGVDPVVLAAAIVTRLQSIVAREIDPFQMGVVTVGALHTGTKANIIPADATMLVNIRAYSEPVRERLLEAIRRIVTAECQAAGSPEQPEFELYDSYPLTDNDPATSEKVRAAFEEHFGPDRVEHLAPVPASEDFSVIPTAFGIPYAYWGVGGFAEGQQAYPNHSPFFGPALQPTLRTATEAACAAALAYLGK